MSTPPYAVGEVGLLSLNNLSTYFELYDNYNNDNGFRKIVKKNFCICPQFFEVVECIWFAMLPACERRLNVSRCKPKRKDECVALGRQVWYTLSMIGFMAKEK